MQLTNRQEIIARIARKYDIPFNEVAKAIRFQFQYVAEVMESGNRETGEFYDVRLPYFGAFKVHRGRIKKNLTQGGEDGISDDT